MVLAEEVSRIVGARGIWKSIQGEVGKVTLLLGKGVEGVTQ